MLRLFRIRNVFIAKLVNSIRIKRNLTESVGIAQVELNSASSANNECRVTVERTECLVTV